MHLAAYYLHPTSPLETPGIRFGSEREIEADHPIVGVESYLLQLLHYSRTDPLVAPIRGRSLLIARAAWVILAIVVLGLDIAGIPYRYAFYQETCTGAECEESGQLTPEGVQNLQQVGISTEFYAAYVGVGFSLVVTLVFFALAAVIFWRRSEDRMALPAD